MLLKSCYNKKNTHLGIDEKILSLHVHKITLPGMTNHKEDKLEDKIIAVEEALSRTEQFIEKYQKHMLYGVGIILVIIAIIMGTNKFYLQPRNERASAEMFWAEKYFELDSLDKAMNGDGEHAGFIEIIDNYKWTKAANLAHFYLGTCYLKKGQFENAISELKEYDSDDEIIAALAIGNVGDAYLELGKKEEALSQYLKAADARANLFTTPQFLMKAGFIYEDSNDWENALKMYERIKKEYIKSQEAREVDKYIARAKAMLNK